MTKNRKCRECGFENSPQYTTCLRCGFSVVRGSREWKATARRDLFYGVLVLLVAIPACGWFTHDIWTNQAKSDLCTSFTTGVLDSRYTVRKTTVRMFRVVPIPIPADYEVRYKFTLDGKLFVGGGRMANEPTTESILVRYDPKSPHTNFPEPYSPTWTERGLQLFFLGLGLFGIRKTVIGTKALLAR